MSWRYAVYSWPKMQHMTVWQNFPPLSSPFHLQCSYISGELSISLSKLFFHIFYCHREIFKKVFLPCPLSWVWCRRPNGIGNSLKRSHSERGVALQIHSLICILISFSFSFSTHTTLGYYDSWLILNHGSFITQKTSSKHYLTHHEFMCLESKWKGYVVFWVLIFVSLVV